MHEYSNIVILGIGYATNLAGLLNSAANYGGDGFASGVSMIETNVKALVWSAGFLGSCSGWDTGENNVEEDTTSTSDLFGSWPTTFILGFFAVWCG